MLSPEVLAESVRLLRAVLAELPLDDADDIAIRALVEVATDALEAAADL